MPIRRLFCELIWFAVLSVIVPSLTAADLGIECTIFNVGQGSGAVIRDKHTGTSFIVDAGNSGTKETISPLLSRFNKTVFGKSTARKRLRGILLSHSDGDHVKLLTCSLQVNSRALKDDRVGGEITLSDLSHHRTCDVAYGGFS